MEAFDLQTQTSTQQFIDEAQQGNLIINNSQAGGGSTTVVNITSVSAPDDTFFSVTTPSPGVAKIARAEIPATVIAALTALVAGDLPVSAAPTQAEIEDIRDAVIENRDLLNGILAELKALKLLAT